MPYEDKNRLGAGDATSKFSRSSKKRLPVPSSRRFGTRSVISDPNLEHKLKTALEEFVTPPETPKRSLTIAEIIPSKIRIFKPNSPNESTKIKAARKITTAMMLHAWRSSKETLKKTIQTSEVLQKNLEQHKIQVQVLQKLRESESQKRNGALNENNLLLKNIEGLKVKYKNLEEVLEELRKREEVLVDEKQKLEMDILRHENIIKVLTNQKSLCQQAYEAEKQELLSTQKQNKLRNQQINELKIQLVKEEKERKDLHELLRMSESKYEECAGNFKNLLQDYGELDKRLEGVSKENEEYESILRGMAYKNEKQEAKILDLKKIISINKTQRKQLEEKVELMNKALQEYEVRMNQQLGKRWWKTSGEFVINSLQSFAYIIFPAMHEDNKITIQNSIALGSL